MVNILRTSILIRLITELDNILYYYTTLHYTYSRLEIFISRVIGKRVIRCEGKEVGVNDIF
jgi:hypothetical protein